jgi:ABC-type sugar transport system ATPase subunit
MKEYFIQMKSISKDFPGVKALENVSLNIESGEILGLLGENGAGKSTLMKILTGVYQSDKGEIIINGEKSKLHDTRDAHAKGISIIFQEFNLCPNLTIVENLFLGNEILNPAGFVDFKKQNEKAESFFKKINIELNLKSVVKDIGVAQQQMTEIVKALLFDVKLLVMDEPTSSLTDKEITILFKIMKELKSQGISIIFISHKLDEVLEITDRIVVLRDGHNAGETTTDETNKDKLIQMMVGRELNHFYTKRKKAIKKKDVVLEIKQFSGPPYIKDISFKLMRGEILGFAGLVGAGRTELAQLIIGNEKKTNGSLYLNGKELKISSPVDAVNNRIGYLSEDRKRLALILSMNVRENITMSIHKKIQNLLSFISSSKENKVCDRYLEDLSIKVSSREQIVNNLSGGNQQKVVISKWLATHPEVLILDEPTRGIDVGAKSEVHRIISELADNGMSIILISSELVEILGISDRILVMYNGEIKADINREDASQETIMKYAVGH